MRKVHYAAALGIPLIALLSFTLVAAWTGPTQSPPGNNVAAPINVGTTDQVKNGGLGVNSLAVFGNSLFGGSTGSIAYLNFGATVGEQGYGIRDNAGLLEFKNSGGSWSSIQATVFNLVGGAGSWAASDNNIYNSNTGNVGIGTASPAAKLDVNGGIHTGSASTGGSCSGNPEGTFAYDPSAHKPVYCNQSSQWTAVGGGYSGPLWQCSCNGPDNQWTLVSNSNQTGGYCSGNGAGAFGSYTVGWSCTQVQ